MGVAVLSPQDCLHNPLSSRQALISPHPRIKLPRNPNANPGRANRSQPNRRKRSPNVSPPSRAADAPAVPGKNLVMGQVKILKRGEPHTKTAPHKAEKVGDLNLGSTDRLGPDPDLVPTQIRLADSDRPGGFYAGSAFITSPPPSSLPLPAFFKKKSVDVKTDEATSDLCRILGLNL